MVINGKRVTGLFKFDSSSIYTEGDLVYKDKVLYQVNTEVTGIDPSDKEMSLGKYTVYLGDKCINIDEYLNYELTKSPVNNKYIPASLLPAILNHYLTGINEKGVIEDLEDYDAKATADEILVNENINYAVYSVSRNLGGLPVDLYSKSLERLNGEKLILKQYTYTEKVEEYGRLVSKRVRVQELIDHTYNMVWYRYKKIDDINSSSSSWKSITLNTTNIHDNILKLANEYKNRINVLQNTLIEMRKNFRYKSIDLPKVKSNSISIPDEAYGKNRITIVSQMKSGNGIYKITNFTINLASSIYKYESDGIYLLVDTESKSIKLYEDKGFKTLHRKAVINDAYIHEYYG